MLFSSISPARSSENIANVVYGVAAQTLILLKRALKMQHGRTVLTQKSWQAIPENRGSLKLTLHSQCTASIVARTAASRNQGAVQSGSAQGVEWEGVMKPLNRRFQRPGPGAQDQTIRAMCQITGTVLAKFNEPLAWPGSARKYSEAVFLSLNLSPNLSPRPTFLSTPSLILFSASLRSAPLSDPSGA